MKTKMRLSDLLFGMEKVIAGEVLASIKEQFAKPDDHTVRRDQTKAVLVKRADAGERTITMYVSTRDMDRDNEVLMPAGADVKDFKRSPVILEGHNYSQAQIGKASSIEVDEYGIKFDIEFAPTDEGDRYLALSKFMPLSASVGFIPLDIVRKGDSDWPKLVQMAVDKWKEFGKNRDKVDAFIRRWSLLEASIVPVPANPHAIQQALATALEEKTITPADAVVMRKSFDIPDHTSEPDPPPAPVAKKVLAARKYVPTVKLVSSASDDVHARAKKVSTEVTNVLALSMGRV